MGKGGLAARSTADGKTIKFCTVDGVKSETAGEVYVSSDGIEGTGVNSSLGVSSREFTKVSYAINNYKNYCRQHIIDTNYGNKKSKLRQFLRKLSESRDIQAAYDIFGLVDEFDDLNHQQIMFQHKFSLKPYLESLLDRVVDFSNTVTSGTKEETVLSHLHASILSRLYVERDKIGTNDCLNVSKCINNFIDFGIGDLMRLNSNEIVDKNRNIYKSWIDDNNYSNYKWQFGGENIIDIESEVEKNLNTIDGDIENLLNTIVVEPNTLKSDQQKHVLEQKLLLRLMFIPLKMAVLISKIFDPINRVVDASPMFNNFNQSITHIVDQLNNRYEIFKVQTIEINKTITDYETLLAQGTVISTDFDLKPIRNVINECQHLISKIDVNPYDDWESIIDENKRRLIKLLSELVTVSPQQEIPNNIQSIDHLIAMINSLELGIDTFNKYKSNDTMIKLIGKIMIKQEERINNIKSYGENVYKVVTLYIPSIKNDVENFKEGYSIAEHLIRKWKLRSFFHDIRLAYSKLSSEISAEETNIRLCLAQIVERISALIGTFDHIAAYFESQQLVDSIGKMNSVKPLENDINDNRLLDFINRSQDIIKSNLMWSSLKELQFSDDFLSTKHHYFPIITFIFDELDKSMRTINSENSLENQIIYQSKVLKRTIHDIKSLSNEYANDLRTYASFRGSLHDSPNQPAFYTWPYDQIKDEIKKLFKGKTVVLHADIVNGFDGNAVKANLMHLHFKLHNRKLQEKFDKEFNAVLIRQTMFGASSYRCHNRIYSIPLNNGPLTFGYDFYGNRYVVDRKIEESPPFYSPYTMWEIKFKANRGISGLLSPFLNEPMDLELVGEGSYLAHGNFTKNNCNDQLDHYYSFHKIIST